MRLGEGDPYATRSDQARFHGAAQKRGQVGQLAGGGCRSACQVSQHVQHAVCRVDSSRKQLKTLTSAWVDVTVEMCAVLAAEAGLWTWRY